MSESNLRGEQPRQPNKNAVNYIIGRHLCELRFLDTYIPDSQNEEARKRLESFIKTKDPVLPSSWYEDAVKRLGDLPKLVEEEF